MALRGGLTIIIRRVGLVFVVGLPGLAGGVRRAVSAASRQGRGRPVVSPR